MNYLKIFLKLWPGLILRLEILNNWTFEQLVFLQRWLIYCEGSPPCWKLSFSKVVIDIGNIDKINHFIFIEFYERLSKLKHLFDSWSKIYDVELENISYEDLFINRTDYFKQYIGRRRDIYNDEKLEFERIWENRKVPWWFLKNTNDGFNQTISELKLKEFKFYADNIKLKRYD